MQSQREKASGANCVEWHLAEFSAYKVFDTKSLNWKNCLLAFSRCPIDDSEICWEKLHGHFFSHINGKGNTRGRGNSEIPLRAIIQRLNPPVRERARGSGYQQGIPARFDEDIFLISCVGIHTLYGWKYCFQINTHTKGILNPGDYNRREVPAAACQGSPIYSIPLKEFSFWFCRIKCGRQSP